MENIKTGMPTVKIQAAYKIQKPCFELEEHFEIKFWRPVSHVHNSQFLNSASKFFSRSLRETHPTPQQRFLPTRTTEHCYHWKKKTFQNQKWLLQKAEKANLRNSRVRKWSTQFYTVSRTFSADNCTTYMKMSV